MSDTAKKIEPAVTETKCKNNNAGITNKGATNRATDNFERTVKESETGKDLQKIMLLSFLSQKMYLSCKLGWQILRRLLTETLRLTIPLL
ncbi:MAG: hypothetical protein Ct9H300mP3_07170 [Gammaproteobacteria bacterium]|nr:MAG: hypothetical protein Ct9H300mP3_07170 [Gammaproteobacteria bacterium]